MITVSKILKFILCMGLLVLGVGICLAIIAGTVFILESSWFWVLFLLIGWAYASCILYNTIFK